MTSVDHFLQWRDLRIAENPTWKDEEVGWFLELYLKTYPARSFSLVKDLLLEYLGPKHADNKKH